MWTVSPAFLDALHYSRVFVTTMDVFQISNAGLMTRVLRNVPLVDGSITCDRKSNTRRTLSAEVVLEYPNDGYTDLINSNNTRVQVWRGLNLNGRPEMVPVGVFRVDSVDQTNKMSLSISGTGLESYVIDDRFVTPYTPPRRAATLEIKFLITSSIPNARIVDQTTSEYVIKKTAPWADDRWGAITEMAESMAADVYCAPDGTFMIVNQPSLRYTPIMWVVDEGPRGVLVELSRNQSRDQVYNAVVARGQTNEAGVALAHAEVYDLDTKSPTYWHGGFGHVPKFFESQFLTSNAQCTRTATNMLGESRGLNKTLTFSTLPNPALEPGDAVLVAMLDDTYEKHILQSFSIPLGDGGWQAQTLALKAADTPEGAFAVSGLIDHLSERTVAANIAARSPDLLGVLQ